MKKELSAKKYTEGKIYSVKRFADGEIFTVGEEVNYPNYGDFPDFIFPIKYFDFLDDKIIVWQDKYKNPLSNAYLWVSFDKIKKINK